MLGITGRLTPRVIRPGTRRLKAHSRAKRRPDFMSVVALLHLLGAHSFSPHAFSRRRVGRRCEGTLCKVTPQSASGWVGAEGRRDSNPGLQRTSLVWETGALQRVRALRAGGRGTRGGRRQARAGSLLPAAPRARAQRPRRAPPRGRSLWRAGLRSSRPRPSAAAASVEPPAVRGSPPDAASAAPLF